MNKTYKYCMTRYDMGLDTPLFAQRRFLAQRGGMPVDEFEILPDDFPVPIMRNDPTSRLAWVARVNEYNRINKTAF